MATNSLFDKIQSIIDLNIVEKFDVKELKSDNFIPICIKESAVLVLTTSTSTHASLTSIISKKLNILNVKFSIIDEALFNQVLDYISSKLADDLPDEDFDDDLENFDDIDDSDIPDDVDSTLGVKRNAESFNDVKVSLAVESEQKSFDEIKLDKHDDLIPSETKQNILLPQDTNSETQLYSEKASKFTDSLNSRLASNSKNDNLLDSPAGESASNLDDTHGNDANQVHGASESVKAENNLANGEHLQSLQVNQPVRKGKEDFSKKKVGEILVELGYVNQDNLFAALIEAKKTHIPLGTILVQRKFVTLENLKKALSLQQGYEFVDEEKLKINASIIKMLPEDFIKLNQVIPISFEDNTLTIGMINPNDKKVINDVVYLTGIRPRIMLITHYEFNKCLETYFSTTKKETDQIIKKMEVETLKMQGSEETLFEQAERELKDDSSTTVKFVNKIVSDAIDMRASDIHIEPRLDCYVVRYRIDGILQEVLRLPAKTESAILTRLKVISKMNIAEHRRPQDGSFTIRYKNKDFDFRINTLPVADKEKMVIRILAPAVSLEAKKEEINLVGASKDDIDLIKRINNVPNGIILATGPTGSGKTTTLYTLLKSINDEGINITTLEDPIEIKIEGINQSQVNTKAGITFASCLRAILRQDPDVILIGEIRDYETLEAAISAALTGHVVLSTLHTNSAAATITRLIEMGAKNYLVSSTVAGIIAQRLVRQLCPECKEQYFASEEEARMVVSDPQDVKNFMQMPIYRAKGCDRCQFKGYTGRIGVYEILQVTKEIKKLIAQGAHDIEIEEAAVGCGMNTLQQACLKHIINGETTISEFVRVLGTVSE